MNRDYGMDDGVRRLRRLGWVLTGLMLLGVVLALAWKIAQVSERRAMESTRERLATSLSNLAAEQLAKDQALEPAWRRTNPFVLLRWQADDYCGELAAGEEPQAGCWYWLPTRAWVLYRLRFGDGRTKEQGELRAYRLLAVPGEMPKGSQSTGDAFALELEAVPRAELSASGWLSH